MEKFTNEESNLIIAGLDMFVKQAGLSNPAAYQMACAITSKLQTAAATPVVPVEEVKSDKDAKGKPKDTSK